MSLNLTSVGFSTARLRFEYDWQRVVLYALGIGATRDELDFLYEGRGPKVYPTFAVIAVFPAVHQLFEKLELDLTRLVQLGQSVRLHRPIPAQAKLETTASVQGIYDMKNFAQVMLVTKTWEDESLCFETEWTLMLRDQGGFNGPRSPKHSAPKIPKGLGPSFTADAQSRPEQALLYRLSGDLNPLHADPEFAKIAGFEQGPILHGLCTMGYAARALVHHACAGDPQRLRSISARFRRPVWPGEVLQTVGYTLEEGTVAFEVFAGGRPDPVLTQAWAELSR